MIRTSKHNISNIVNLGKLTHLDQLFIMYRHDLDLYINYIINGTLPLSKLLSSKILPNGVINHARYKQLIYKQASEIIRSQLNKSTNKRYHHYKKIYSYFKKNHPDSLFTKTKYSDLKLNNIIQTKYFIKPSLNNLTINLDERFFDIKISNHFDNFVKIILPYFNEKKTKSIKINVPLQYHKHSNSLLDSGFTLKKSIQIKYNNGNYYINLIWFKKDPEKQLNGKSIGIDLGYNKLLCTSEKQIIGQDITKLYDQIANKKQGSKNFKQLLSHRDNEINKYCNQLLLTDVNQLVIEDLLNVKHKSKFSRSFNNKLQRWSYIKVINKIERICEVNGINLVKVSPSYTSQTCSMCGSIHKDSRKGDQFKCVDCGYEIDADYNASININNRGVYSLSSHQKDIFT